MVAQPLPGFIQNVKNNSIYTVKWCCSAKTYISLLSLCDHLFPIDFLVAAYCLFRYKKKHSYIHSVIPGKTSKRIQHLWYDFELQAAGKSVGRVVSFNSSFHTHMQHYEQSKTPVLLKNVIVHLVQVIRWLTTNQQHICVQILMSPLSAKLHPNLSQQPQSCQLQTLLLNSSWPLQQTRKMMFLGHCPLGTKNQIKLW